MTDEHVQALHHRGALIGAPLKRVEGGARLLACRAVRRRDMWRGAGPDLGVSATTCAPHMHIVQPGHAAWQLWMVSKVNRAHQQSA